MAVKMAAYRGRSVGRRVVVVGRATVVDRPVVQHADAVEPPTQQGDLAVGDSSPRLNAIYDAGKTGLR